VYTLTGQRKGWALEQITVGIHLARGGGTLALNGLLPRASAAQQARLRLGLIGCGSYGRNDTRAAFKVGNVEMVGLCDVDSQHLADTAAEVEELRGARPRTFKHYEELLATPGLTRSSSPPAALARPAFPGGG
jgi:hypothetical protein